MKTKFRVIFKEEGWKVQYKNPFRKWIDCNTLLYRRKSDAETVVRSLTKGLAPTSWYEDEE